MSQESRQLYKTYSVCPVCLKKIPAQYVQRDDTVFLEKKCDIHGDYSTVVWRGEADLLEWQKENTVYTESLPECDMNCRGCGKHYSPPCCVVLEITERCNLHCPLCLAGAGEDNTEKISLDDIKASLDDMFEKGVRSVHFGGGEPTIRDDLPEIIKYASDKGYEYIQINTNGIRIAKEEGYAEKLVEAGAHCAFLQFDGTDDAIYQKLRGADLFDIKKKAIEECDIAYLGVILVPAVVPGVNERNIGNIIRFAFENMPAVRGVHFQPVTYMGRSPEETDFRHITIPELLKAMEEQSGGLIRAEDIRPSVADSSLCGFHCEYRKENGTLNALPHREGASCCCGPSKSTVVNAAGETLDLSDAVKRSQDHVKNRWSRIRSDKAEAGSLDALLAELRDSNFSLSGMAFMDTSNMDMRRLMQCTLRVYRDGALVPFCLAHSVTDLL